MTLHFFQKSTIFTHRTSRWQTRKSRRRSSNSSNSDIGLTSVRNNNRSTSRFQIMNMNMDRICYQSQRDQIFNDINKQVSKKEVEKEEQQLL